MNSIMIGQLVVIDAVVARYDLLERRERIYRTIAVYQLSIPTFRAPHSAVFSRRHSRRNWDRMEHSI